MPVSRMMYGMAFFFLVMTIIWTIFIDVVLLDQVIRDIGSFLIFGIVGPIIWFIVFLFVVKICFFSYHEIIERNLIVSVPPRRVKVPLEEIVEIEIDAGKIKTDFGKVNLDAKVEESPLEKEHYWGRFKTFGTRVQHFGNEMIIQPVFSDKNLVRIRTKTQDIIINVPDVKEFVTEILKAMQSCKSSLNLR